MGSPEAMFWLNDWSDTGQALHPWRQQNLSLSERQDRVPLPTAQEPSSYCVDRIIQEAAQEGYHRSELHSIRFTLDDMDLYWETAATAPSDRKMLKRGVPPWHPSLPSNPPSTRLSFSSFKLLTIPNPCTGNLQKAHPPHRKATTRHRRRPPRTHQRPPLATTRGPRGSTQGGDRERQGEEGDGREQEEGREGEERGRSGEGSAGEDTEQDGVKGCA